MKTVWWSFQLLFNDLNAFVWLARIASLLFVQRPDCLCREKQHRTIESGHCILVVLFHGLIVKNLHKISFWSFQFKFFVALECLERIPKNLVYIEWSYGFRLPWVWLLSVSVRSRTLFYYHDRLLNSIAPISFDIPITEMFGVVTPGKIIFFFYLFLPYRHLLYTYWEILTKKLCRKLSYAK